VIEPPFLGQDYTVVSGPRSLLPAVLPRQREAEIALPALPVQRASAVEILPL
jgi:hypothetical protein